MRRTLTATLAIWFLGLTGASAESFTDHVDHDHSTIRITSRKIYPEVAKLGSSDAVAWGNLSDHVAVVSFPEDILKNLICTKPTNFEKDGDRFNSVPLRGNEFASVCSFKPGRYEYEVRLVAFQPSSSSPSTLKGVLEVD